MQMEDSTEVETFQCNTRTIHFRVDIGNHLHEPECQVCVLQSRREATNISLLCLIPISREIIVVPGSVIRKNWWWDSRIHTVAVFLGSADEENEQTLPHSLKDSILHLFNTKDIAGYLRVEQAIQIAFNIHFHVTRFGRLFNNYRIKYHNRLSFEGVILASKSL